MSDFVFRSQGTSHLGRPHTIATDQQTIFITNPNSGVVTLLNANFSQISTATIKASHSQDAVKIAPGVGNTFYCLDSRSRTLTQHRYDGGILKQFILAMPCEAFSYLDGWGFLLWGEFEGRLIHQLDEAGNIIRSWWPGRAVDDKVSRRISLDRRGREFHILVDPYSGTIFSLNPTNGVLTWDLSLKTRKTFGIEQSAIGELRGEPCLFLRHPGLTSCLVGLSGEHSPFTVAMSRQGIAKLSDVKCFFEFPAGISECEIEQFRGQLLVGSAEGVYLLQWADLRPITTSQFLASSAIWRGGSRNPPAIDERELVPGNWDTVAPGIYEFASRVLRSGLPTKVRSPDRLIIGAAEFQYGEEWEKLRRKIESLRFFPIKKPNADMDLRIIVTIGDPPQREPIATT